MADLKISQLTATVTPAGTDEFAVNQANVSKKTTLQQIKDFVAAILRADINARGDLIVGQANDTPSILSVGANGHALFADSTQALGMIWRAIAAGDLPSAIDAAKIGAGTVSSTVFGYLAGVTSAIQTQIDGKAALSHKDTHKTGGSDAFTVADLLDAVARLIVAKAGTTIGTRRKINLVQGNNIGIDVVDIPADEQVNITISAAGGALGTDELSKVGAGGTADYLNSNDFEQDAVNHIRLRLDQRLVEWTEGEDYELTTPAYDSDSVLTGGTVKWPDGSAGTLTVTTKNTTWLAVDAFTITHTNSSKTVTQAAVTRSSTNGSITAKPALTVA